jgi:hypothetical protein
MRMMEVIIADSFPVTLVCLSNGKVRLTPLYDFTALFDQTPGGVAAIFDSEGFSLLEPGRDPDDFQDYFYHVEYDYKTMPVLKAWLVQQNLINPLG